MDTRDIDQAIGHMNDVNAMLDSFAAQVRNDHLAMEVQMLRRRLDNIQADAAALRELALQQEKPMVLEPVSK